LDTAPAGPETAFSFGSGLPLPARQLSPAHCARAQANLLGFLSSGSVGGAEHKWFLVGAMGRRFIEQH